MLFHGRYLLFLIIILFSFPLIAGDGCNVFFKNEDYKAIKFSQIRYEPDCQYKGTCYFASLINALSNQIGEKLSLDYAYFQMLKTTAMRNYLSDEPSHYFNSLLRGSQTEDAWRDFFLNGNHYYMDKDITLTEGFSIDLLFERFKSEFRYIKNRISSESGYKKVISTFTYEDATNKKIYSELSENLIKFKFDNGTQSTFELNIASDENILNLERARIRSFWGGFKQYIVALSDKGKIYSFEIVDGGQNVLKRKIRNKSFNLPQFQWVKQKWYLKFSATDKLIELKHSSDQVPRLFTRSYDSKLNEIFDSIESSFFNVSHSAKRYIFNEKIQKEISPSDYTNHLELKSKIHKLFNKHEALVINYYDGRILLNFKENQPLQITYKPNRSAHATTITGITENGVVIQDSSMWGYVYLSFEDMIKMRASIFSLNISAQ